MAVSVWSINYQNVQPDAQTYEMFACTVTYTLYRRIFATMTSDVDGFMHVTRSLSHLSSKKVLIV